MSEFRQLEINVEAETVEAVIGRADVVETLPSGWRTFRVLGHKDDPRIQLLMRTLDQMREMREEKPPPEPPAEEAWVTPRCETCGTTCVRGATVGGKGRYTCPDPTCPESFKRWYVRGSRPR